MATIVFMMDIEEGHLFPSFSFANALQKAGHKISYISVPDNEDAIIKARFTFHPIFAEHYPKGFRKRYLQLKQEIGYKNKPRLRDHINNLFDTSFQVFLENLKADLFIINCFLNIEALVLYYQFNIKFCMLRPFLWDNGLNILKDSIADLTSLSSDSILRLFDLAISMGQNPTTFADLVKPFKEFPELVVCSDKFEIESAHQTDRRVYYMGPDLLQRHQAPALPLPEKINPGKKLIYASMGSQSITYDDIFDTFFLKMVHTMGRSDMTDFHLIISIGKDRDRDDYSSELSNISVVNWAPQIDILHSASLAIIHGGLGTIKECIYSEVPMIVLPVAHDQPANGKRVEHHNLGTSVELATISEDELAKKIHQVVDDMGIKDSLNKMRTAFLDLDRQNIGLAVVENLISAKTPE